MSIDERDADAEAGTNNHALRQRAATRKPLPCPRCGRVPQLSEGFKYAWDHPATEQSIILLKYECRRWLGLRLCFGPVDWHWIEKGWRDVGHREAVRKWNEAVERWRRIK